MKKLFSFIVLCTFVLSLVSCGSKRSQAYYDQPSQVLSANLDGSYVIRTQVRSKDAVTAFTDAQRKVVKEVIFNGVKAANNGVSDLKPLCFEMNAQEKYEDYWNAFFSDNGDMNGEQIKECCILLPVSTGTICVICFAPAK